MLNFQVTLYISIVIFQIPRLRGSILTDKLRVDGCLRLIILPPSAPPPSPPASSEQFVSPASQRPSWRLSGKPAGQQTPAGASGSRSRSSRRSAPA